MADVAVASDAAEGPTGEDAAIEAGEERDAGEVEASAARHCPKDMVNVAGRLCIDRYEDSLVDDATGERLSPITLPSPASRCASLPSGRRSD